MFGDPTSNPKKWPIFPIGKIAVSITNGMTRRNKESEMGNNIVLRLRDIRPNWIDFSDLNRISLNASEAGRFEVLPGDVLFIRVNGNPDYVGRCATFSGYSEPVFFNDHIMRLKTNEEMVDGKFLSFILNSPHCKQEIALHRKTSAGQHTINQDGLCRVLIPIPPLNLQQEFARRIAAVEKLKATHRASLAQLDALFASLQHRAFRGEL
jgi:restriction endonuclease S subunit